MKPVLLDIDEICKDLPEVISDKPQEGRKIAKNGLFSQQIFGPIKSWKCDCPKSIYRGPHSGEKKCGICNVDIISSEVRRKRYAKIKLPFPVLNPIFYYLILNSKPSLKQTIDNILFYKSKYRMLDDGSLEKINPLEDASESDTVLYGLSGIKLLVEKLCETSKSEDFRFIKENLHLLTINNALVIPPDFRNFSKSSTGKILMDKINQHYTELLFRISRINKLSFKLTEEQEVFKNYFRSIQFFTNNIYDYVFERLSKKKGLIRKNILGKRLDFSGRAVISPDPTLLLDECKIPYKMLLEVFKPQLTAYMIDRKIYKRYNLAVKDIEDCINTGDNKLFNIVMDYCKGRIVILNRQPTLHRLSILAFHIIPTFGTTTIQVHPLFCRPQNADFDGDALAAYFPITEESIKEAEEKIGIWNNLISPTDCGLVPVPNQDVLLGIYYLTE